MSEGKTPADYGVLDYTGTYLDFLGFQVIEAKPDFVRLQMSLDRIHTNTVGMAHGGILMSMLDIAGAFSAHGGNLTNQVSITMTQATQFMRPVTGDHLIAEGHVVRRAGRTAFTQSVILDPSHGDEREEQICATAQCTFRIKDRPTTS